MEICYDGALVMPSSYAVMNEEEMTYVAGGAPLYLTRKMLNKDYCKRIAKSYVDSTGLSETRIAVEIFSHAVLFLYGNMAKILPVIGNLPYANETISYILSHSNPVDIGKDPWYRVGIYYGIWAGIPNLA